jgi:hypothetical protein
MGLISDTPDLYTFICDGCDATYTGKPHELPKLGWHRHGFVRSGSRRSRGEILLCDSCSAHYEPIWARKKAA